MVRRHSIIAAALALLFSPALPAGAQTSTGSTFSFTIRHEQERGVTARSGEGIVAGEKARLRFGEVGGGDASRSPIRANSTVLVTGAGDPVESLVIVDDLARMLVRPARMLEEMRRMLAMMPRAPQIAAQLVSLRADTTEPETRHAGLPTRRYRAAGEILVVFSLPPGSDVVSTPDTMRVTLATDVLHSWAAPGNVDPFRGIQTLDLLLGAQAGGNATIAAEMAKILAALPQALPVRSEWTITVAQHGRTRTEREIIELSNVGNAAVKDADVALPGYPDAPPMQRGNLQ